MSLGGASAGAQICIDYVRREYLKQVEVGVGDTINVTFAGVPPYNLTTSPSSGLAACQTASEPLDRNWYVWTVESVVMNGSYSGGGLDRTEEAEHEFGVIDDEVYFAATELNGTGGQHRFSGSPKYKIQAESSSASRSSMNPKHFYLAALLVVPALLTL